MSVQYIHVHDKRTGHEYPVPAHLFDSEHHRRTGKPTHDRHGDLVPAKPHTTVAKAASRKPRRAGKRPVARKVADPASTSGHLAETDKE